MKLNLITSTDKLRPIFHFVKITKSQMFATNGHAAGVIPTNSLFDDDFIEDIPEDGILVHSEDFFKITQGLTFQWKVAGEIIKIINKNKRDVLIEVETEEKQGKFPDVLRCVPINPTSTQIIGIDFSIAKLLQDALGFQSSKVEFFENGIMQITSPLKENQNFGILMPINLK